MTRSDSGVSQCTNRTRRGWIGGSADVIVSFSAVIALPCQSVPWSEQIYGAAEPADARTRPFADLTSSRRPWTYCPSTYCPSSSSPWTWCPWPSNPSSSNPWTYSTYYPWTSCPFSYHRRRPPAQRPNQPRRVSTTECSFSSVILRKIGRYASSAITAPIHVLISFPLLQAGVRLTVL